MTQVSHPDQEIRPARARDAHGLAVLLLAVALALGTALPRLGPPPPDAETTSRIAPGRAALDARAGAPAESAMAGRRVAARGVPSKPLLVLPLDLNAVGAEALQGLPGIGPTLAERIVADREAHGPFQTAEDLLRVPGIGPKRWERIRHAIRVVTEGP